ncbi:hypothetical protein M9H77_14168 [Catharanthus roseus]|uniref:Uncharacterized protein n=1 Tax=Catharanthus roseus TaxID=4058 RepID=A0ACC0BM99_CATRO|nr:hypothetical protein M9H77_14168 [Catharanthus roseus]
MSSLSALILHPFGHTLHKKLLPKSLKPQCGYLQETSFLKDRPLPFCKLQQSQVKAAHVIPTPAPVHVESFKIDDTEELINYIKWVLRSIGEGRISESPYVTSWVALVPHKDGNGCRSPKFPSCLRWIAENQLTDGSWGLSSFFSAYDRLINTLGCVIALKTWNMHSHQTDKELIC